MNRHLFVAVVVCALTLGLVATSNAWLIDATANVDTNSDNKYSSDNDNSINVGDNGKFSSVLNNQRYSTSTSNSNNKTDNRNQATVDSFNTDNRNYGDYSNRSDNKQDNSIKDSNNDYADKSNNSVNGSFNKYVTAGGDVRNSVMGDFNQTYSGTDFRSGVTGSGNTIDTSSVNITTLGDTLK